MLFRTKTALAYNRILWGPWKDPKEKHECIDFRLEGPHAAPLRATSYAKTAMAPFLSTVTGCGLATRVAKELGTPYASLNPLHAVCCAVFISLCAEVSPPCPVY